MLTLTHNFAFNINNKETTDIIYVDCSKVFDSVYLDIILHKLKSRYINYNYKLAPPKESLFFKFRRVESAFFKVPP